MGLNFKNIEKQINQAKGGFAKRDFEFMTLKHGDSIFTVLEPKEDLDGQAHYDVWIHFGLVDGEGNNRVYKCSKGAHGSCPICDRVAEMADQAAKTGDEALAKQANQLKGQKRSLYLVLDEALNLKVLTAKPTQAKQIDIEILNAYKDEGINITQFGQLKSIRLSRLRQDPWASARYLAKSNVVVPDKKIEAIKESMPELSTVYEDFSPEELERMLQGEEISKIPRKKKEQAEPKPEPEVETKPIERPAEPDEDDTEVTPPTPPAPVSKPVVQEKKKEEPKQETKPAVPASAAPTSIAEQKKNKLAEILAKAKAKNVGK
jgi:hypothetical protein